MSDCGNVQKVFVPAKEEEKVNTIAPIKGIEIRPKAAEKIKLFLANEGKSADQFGLRIAVKKDGCSGLSYDMSLAELSASETLQDKIFSHEGAFVMIEKSSYFYVTGSYLDYSEALTGSGFSLVNPNIKKTCSCGSSFAV